MEFLSQKRPDVNSSLQLVLDMDMIEDSQRQLGESRTLSPIVIFAYNRPDHLRSCLDALGRNPEAKQSQIRIIVDGARGVEDSQSVLTTVDIARRHSPSPKTTVVARTSNLGLAGSIIDGVTKALNEWDTVIVIEDDLLVAPGFLAFMNASLKIYRHESTVVSVHGYVPPLPRALDQNFFLPGADCWGWATWRRGWAVFEPDGSRLLWELREKNLRREFNYGDNFPFFEMLEDQVAGKNDSWAIRWQASAFLAEKLTYHPAESLVENIGFDGTGTHGGASSRWDTAVGTAPQPGRTNPEVDDEILALYRKFYASISGRTSTEHSNPTVLHAVRKIFAEMVYRIGALLGATKRER